MSFDPSRQWARPDQIAGQRARLGGTVGHMVDKEVTCPKCKKTITVRCNPIYADFNSGPVRLTPVKTFGCDCDLSPNDVVPLV